MKSSRRDFLRRAVLVGGAISLGGELIKAVGSPLLQDKYYSPELLKKRIHLDPVDHRYAPSEWQELLSMPFADQPSLIGRNAELLFGRPKEPGKPSEFPTVISSSLEGRPEFVSQEMEDASVPIIITTLKFGADELKVTSFASNRKDEGRVDNHIVELNRSATFRIELVSGSKWKSTELPPFSGVRKRGTMLSDPEGMASIFVDAGVESEKAGKSQLFNCERAEGSDPSGLKYVIRVPRAGQTADALKAGFLAMNDVLAETRAFWTSWKADDPSVTLSVGKDNSDAASAALRQIIGLSSKKDGKVLFTTGVNAEGAGSIVECVPVVEALTFSGFQDEARKFVYQIWDKSDQDGLFRTADGQLNIVDTAAAAYATARYAEMMQDWDFFSEVWPDIHKSLSSLYDARAEGRGLPNLNSKYNIMPRSFLYPDDEEVSGEFAGTFWTFAALRVVMSIATKLLLDLRTETRDFLRILTIAFNEAWKAQLKKHPDGFSYLPVLLSDDPKANPKKMAKFPIQYGQYHLASTLFPGCILPPDHAVSSGFFNLMKTILIEDVASGTGRLGAEGIENCMGPALASNLITIAAPEDAASVFRAFLNHASPAWAWRREQSAHDSAHRLVLGEMPYTPAAAEAVRYVRNTLVMEMEKSLLLACGLVEPDFAAGKPIGIVNTPTKWGFVTFNLNPLADGRWVGTFERSRISHPYIPTLDSIEFPQWLSSHLIFEKVTGAKMKGNGYRLMIDGETEKCEVTWRKL